MTVDPALSTYEAFAAIYDRFNSTNDYEMWLGRGLLPELRKHGLREGGTVLDVACGTGRAFEPLLRRGWQITGCDLSPAMLELAARKAGDEVELHLADMRELPTFGRFDLVCALNDSVNYLLGELDLELVLVSMKNNLAEGGLIIFDVNCSSVYATTIGEVKEVRNAGSRWSWTDLGEVEPSIFESEIAGDELTSPIRHLERLRSEPEVLGAIRGAALDPVAVLGMSEADGEVVLLAPPDEGRDYKVVFIATVAQ